MLKNKITWKSTVSSRSEQKQSILAIAETIFFVFLTWYFAWKIDSTIYIIIAVTLAPLLLLKTDVSIKKGINLFLYRKEFDKKNMYKSKLLWIITILGMFTSGLLSNLLLLFLYTIIPIQNNLLMLGIIYCAIIGVIFGSILTIFGYLRDRHLIVGLWVFIAFTNISSIEKDYYYLILIIIALPLCYIIGMLIGFLCRSLIVKVYVTLIQLLINPIDTLSQIPKNFREQIFVNDIFYSPELLPDIWKVNKSFQASGIIENSKNKHIHLKSIAYIICFFLLPAYLYRWSIKSTAWFYFPLIYIFNLNKINNKTLQKTKITDQRWSVIKWFNIFSAILLFLYIGTPRDLVQGYYPYIDIFINSILEITNIIPFVKNILEPNSFWLVFFSIILYSIVYGFSSFKSFRKEEKLQNDFLFLDSFAYWIIRIKVVLWYIFFSWNIVLLWNKYIWISII